MKKFWQVVTGLIITFNNINAQEKGTFFHNLSLEDNLTSQNYNYYIYKDTKGFVWISSLDGLNRFDGKTSIPYLPSTTNSFSIRNGEILSHFFENIDGNIWFSTTDALNVYDRKMGIFDQVHIYNNNEKLEGAYYILDYFPTDDNFWCRVDNTLFVYFPNKEIKVKTIGDYHINIFSALKKEGDTYNLLTPIKKGIEFRQFKKFYESAQVDTILPSYEINKILFLNKKNIWVGSKSGLIKFDLTTKIHKTFTDFKYKKLESITDIAVIDSSNLVVSTGNQGIYTFNTNENTFTSQIHQNKNLTIEAFLHPVDRIYVDNMQTIWISTPGRGIFWGSLSKRKFKTFLQKKTKIESQDSFIRSITEDRKGNIWILTQNGITILNAEGEIQELSTLFQGKNSPFHQKFPFYIYTSKDNSIWVCDYSGLYHLLPNKNKFLPVKLNDILPNASIGFYNLKELSNDRILASSSKGIFQWNKDEQLMERLIGIEDTSSAFTWIEENTKTNSILIRKVRSDFLLGHLEQDVFVTDTTISFKPFINYLHHDSLVKQYWLATSEGLHWIEYEGKNYKLVKDTVLQFQNINGVLRENNSDNLWLSSNRGIIKYNIKTGEQRVYGLEDGVQSLEFNFFASHKSKSGKLLFGGVNGLNIFDPKMIVDDAKPAKPTITSMLVNDVPPEKRLVCSKTGNQNISYIEHLEFPIDQNTLSFNFAALDYVNPDANQFRYRMKGQEDKWVFSDTKNFARYANLPPNNYTFEVDATNSDGVWSDKPAQLRITIHPPWYQTWFAYIGYLIIGICSFLGIYNFQINQRLKEAEAHRLKELDRIKTALYTNITHEFRTPLTIILGMADQIKNKPQIGFQQGLEMIRRSGQNLLNLVNQMLDLSKVESGNMRPQYVQGDIVQFLEYLVESFQSFAASKNINVTFYNEVPSLMMDYDINKLQTIVTNLLSNATKFTPEKGKIIVHVQQIKEERGVDKNWCQLKIKDNGIGIDEKDLPYIFDRFYQIDDSSTRHSGGTGIGLALTKELVELMDGNITAHSQLNIGTEFTIILPIRQTAAFAKEFGKAQLIERIEVRVAESKHMGEDTSKDANVPLVLIIEDNLDVITYLQSCMEEEYRVSIALDGKAGIEKALEIIPDIIITDVMMPLKDGYEVCETLKAAEQTSHIPIIMLTAKAQIEAKIEGLSKGADAYLSKPFHQKELEVRLAQLLTQRRKLQAFYSQQSVATTPIKLENPFLQKIIEIIENDLAKDWDIEAFSQQLSMSSSQVYRKIKALTGDSTTIYIRNIRLKNAQHLLLTTDKNISEIAYSVGFNDPAFFSRSYSKLYGISPSHTRKNRK